MSKFHPYLVSLLSTIQHLAPNHLCFDLVDVVVQPLHQRDEKLVRVLGPILMNQFRT
jgi:hypothetical protein